jgi:hypothetical protein
MPGIFALSLNVSGKGWRLGTVAQPISKDETIISTNRAHTGLLSMAFLLMG